MKIAQVVSYQESVPPRSKNGLEFVVSWLTEELVKRGHEVTLFAPADSKTKAKLKSIYPTNVNNDKNVVWYFADYGHRNLSYAVSQAENFDLLHCHTHPAMFSGLTNKPILYTIHSPYNDNFRKKYLVNKKYAKHLKPVIDNYKKINYITISKFQQEKYKKCKPYYFKNFTNIYNGIPVEKFEFNENPQDYLFFMGYLSENKGAHVAIQIAKKLKMKLIIAGEYYKKKPLYFNKHIKPYLNKNIKYVGPVNFRQKVKLFKNAKACLNPITWDEPFGLIPVEAQVCGAPVVAFKKGAMSEIINHNKTGFVVNTEQQMIKAIKNIDKIKREDCRKWAERNFSIEKMVDGYEKYYKKILKK